jgi:hypothetical protein
MRLVSVEINGFRSVKRPLTLRIDSAITILIGANDHGKTGLLEALRSLNDDRGIAPADENWDLLGKDSTRIAHEFLLEDEEISTLDVLMELFRKTEGNTDAANVKDPVIAPVRVTYVRTMSNSVMQVLLDGREITESIIRDKLLRLRPRVELFTSSDQVMDMVSIDVLDRPEQEFMQGIFRYAGIWDGRRELFSQTPATARRLERASEEFTARIREEWRQGEDLTFKFQHAGTNGNQIELLIRDPAVSERFVRPSERSEGFSAFFKLNMRLLARTQTNPAHHYLFLFDEPGTALHPAGQVNLQRVFERLATENQIVYATHSLFMINHNRPERSRVISKTIEGTLVDQKPYLQNWRAVKDALGLIFASNFFIAQATILLEGESDAMYLGALLAACDRARYLDCDLNLFSAKWAGNARDYEPMARLMLEEGRRVVTLIDGDNAGTAMRRRIERLNELINEHHVTAKEPAHIIQLPAHHSIEDILLDRQQFIRCVLDLAEQLVAEGAREYNDPAIWNREANERILKEKPVSTTLGKHVELTTKAWFKSKEPLSKLAIAARYCEWLQSTCPTADVAPAPLGEIVQALGLQSKLSDKAVLTRTANA